MTLIYPKHLTNSLFLVHFDVRNQNGNKEEPIVQQITKNRWAMCRDKNSTVQEFSVSCTISHITCILE